MINYLHSLSIAVLLLLLTREGVQAQYTGDWLVKLSGRTVPRDLFYRAEFPAALPASDVTLISADLNIWRIAVRKECSTVQRWLQRQPEVLVMQENFELSLRGIVVPDDPLFETQWQLLNENNPGMDIHAPEAWSYSTGGLTPAGDTIVIAVIDAGFNTSHADIAPNQWKNTAEVPNDGLDNDGNGFIDDYRGWNVISQNDEIQGTATLHGNGVAGIIGASGNNSKGIAGINWNTKMMFVSGGNTMAGILAACDYIRINRKLFNQTGGQRGAMVVAVNNSWGLDYGMPTDAPLWCEMIELMGNEGVITVSATANNPVDIDLVGDLPTTCPAGSLVTVTSLSATGQLASTSSWGSNTVDIGTFGEEILSTGSQGYAILSGASFAAPHVAGAIGLLYSAKCPDLTVLNYSDPVQAMQKARELVLGSADPVQGLSGVTVSGGRLNIGNLMSTYEKGCPVCPSPFVPHVTSGIFDASVSWHKTLNALAVQMKWRIENGDWMLSDSIITDTLQLQELQSCTRYEFQIRAFCPAAGWSQWSSSAWFLTEGCCTVSSLEVVSEPHNSAVSVSWSPPEYYSKYRILHKPVDSMGSWTVITTDSPLVMINDLMPCTSYEVKIFGFCLDGWNLLLDNFQCMTKGCGACYDAGYCLVYSPDAQEEWISSVKLGDWEHVSAQGGSGYQNFSGKTDSIPRLFPLSTVSLTITPGFWGGGYKEYYRVFIDYNFNGVFETPGELVFDSGFALQGPISGVINTPLFPATGITRMRVMMKYTEVDPIPPDPCANFEFGQVEDYCVELVTALTSEASPDAPVRWGVYPSPATDFVKITHDGFEDLRVQIYSADGMNITSGNTVGGVITFPVTDWPAGIYYIQARAGDEVWRRALLKM